jgi:hypothetical protein
MNNPGIYDAVIAGVGGTVQATASTNTALVAFADRADILATAVDSLIGIIPGGVTASQLTLMGEVVSGLVANRFLGDFSGGSHPDYTGMAIEIVRLYNEMETQLQNVPVPSVIANTHVADVATLRATPALIPAGTIYLDCHTYPNIGGGDLHWNALSVEADNNGNCYQVAGVPVGRWIRSDRVNLTKLVYFGADPDGTAASDAALLAAYNYIKTGVEQKSIIFGDGHFKFALPIDYITVSNLVLLGNERSTVLEFTGGGHGIVFTTQLIGFCMKGFHITCNAVPSGNMFDFSTGTAGLIAYDIDVSVGGKWNKVMGGGGSIILGRGAFQWGFLKLVQLAPGNAPSNGIYLEGCYFNSCWTYVDFYGIAGDAIHLEGMVDYVWGGWAEFEGSIQDCGRALYLKDSASYRFRNFYSENQPTLDLLVNCQRLEFIDYSTTGLDLVGTTDINCRYMGGMIRADNASFGIHTDNNLQGRPGIGDAFVRTNISAVTEGGPYILDLAGGAPGGWGSIDPQNVMLGGDMSRWIGGAANQIWAAPAGNYSATKCGIGSVDVTKTDYADNSALLAVNPATPAQPWIAGFTIIPAGALDDTFIGVPIFVSFKAKGYDGPMPGAAITAIGVIGLEHRSYGCGVPCENGFTRFVMVRRLTAALIASGLQFDLTGINTENCYVSEITVTIGNGAPRTYVRPTDVPWAPGFTIDNYGRAIWYTTAIPVAPTDPLLARTVQEGDLAVVINPATETTVGGSSFRTISYSRIAGVWEPNQLLTGLVAAP